ncbi:MAG: META domain-containing protein [Betaproteobacteria bacterium]|nr:META domain-containing protein [Betaproteobacteria bacterium]
MRRFRWRFFLALVSLVTGAASVAGSRIALFGTEWYATQIAGLNVAAGGLQRAPNLNLDEDGTVHGFAGCNRFFGSFEIRADRLTFGSLALTKMACLDPGTGELESRFVRALRATASATVSGDVLELKDAAGKLLGRFESRSPR